MDPVVKIRVFLFVVLGPFSLSSCGDRAVNNKLSSSDVLKRSMDTIDFSGRGFVSKGNLKLNQAQKDFVAGTKGLSLLITLLHCYLDITSISIAPPIIASVVRAPIPEDQQHELFKWMLEEKRKVNMRDAGEKRRIDVEKYIMKQFIQANSIPSL